MRNTDSFNRCHQIQHNERKRAPLVTSPPGAMSSSTSSAPNRARPRGRSGTSWISTSSSSSKLLSRQASTRGCCSCCRETSSAAERT
ncbi:hypothetical protein PRUPE_4G289300 [Prunus persica]|uniref:Uncharacterized protein n=1 Tax=Prunus persica TaxID=3760 RepID=A0A251PW10_PRUPE|nr:hypothetical protein PRUPE_4G289300 [Prunus persica]